MSLDYLSGLLLMGVVLATVVYLVKEMLADRVGDVKKLQRNLADTFARHVASETKPVNAHLIGALGKVVANSGEAGRPMRVRLGTELWSARSNSAEGGSLVIGTPIKVVAVEGTILDVEEAIDASESFESP